MIPHFIIDEELENVQKHIKDLLTQYKHPELKKHSKTLKKFARALAFSLAKPKEKIRQPIMPRREIELQLARQPIGYNVLNPPAPGEPEKEFQVVPIYVEEIIQKPQAPKEEIIALIRDKFTDKILSTATVNDTYKIAEPNIDDIDKKVLLKVISKSPKNMEKGWKLIEKYIRKYGADPTHKEAIKYYVVNNLLSLGKIEPLLNDINITEIICDSPGSYVQIKRNNKTLKTNILFETRQELDTFLFYIAKLTNSKLDKKNPILDATFRNYRFHCTFGSDITSSKFTITKIE